MEEHYRKLERMYLGANCNEYYKPEIAITREKTEVRIPVRDDFFHAAGTAHGALYFKALDDACFFAASSVVTDVFLLTGSFSIRLLKPVKDGVVRAVATVQTNDRRLIGASAVLYDSEGDLVGRGAGAFVRSKIKLGPDVGYA